MRRSAVLALLASLATVAAEPVDVVVLSWSSHTRGDLALRLWIEADDTTECRYDIPHLTGGPSASDSILYLSRIDDGPGGQGFSEVVAFGDTTAAVHVFGTGTAVGARGSYVGGAAFVAKGNRTWTTVARSLEPGVVVRADPSIDVRIRCDGPANVTRIEASRQVHLFTRGDLEGGVAVGGGLPPYEGVNVDHGRFAVWNITSPRTWFMVFNYDEGGANSGNLELASPDDLQSWDLGTDFDVDQEGAGGEYALALDGTHAGDSGSFFGALAGFETFESLDRISST